MFVDGYNLYYGLHSKTGRKYLWLDLHAMAERLLKPNQQLVAVNYFTARRRNDPPAEERQSAYLQALKATGVNVAEGRYQEKTRSCLKCTSSWRDYEEKETDVALAIALLEGANAEAFDVAMLVTGDGDMVPAVRAVKRLAHPVRVIAVFPPNRFSDELRKATDAKIHLKNSHFSSSQLPVRVPTATGHVDKPPHWT